MAKRKKQELIDSYSSLIGENTSDEAIAFLEDLSDSIDDELQTNYDDLKAKYDSLDGEWRERYIARFKNIDEDPHTSEVIETEQVDDPTDVVDATENAEVSFDDIVL